MKNLIKGYLKFMWHHAQAYSLLTIPLNGLNVVISTFTFLAVAFGLKFPWYAYVSFFVVEIILVALTGIVLVKAGLVSYFQSLNNSQSPELLEILEKINELKDARP